MRQLMVLIFVCFAAASIGMASAKDLRIGITQYPTTLHPLFDSMLAKSYVLAMTQRSMTSYDENWELVCLLCTELPTMENALAEVERLENGGEGIAVTYEIHPEAHWGDGTPVTVDDVLLAWEIGRHPQAGAANLESYKRILSIDRHDAKRFTIHNDRVTYKYNDASGFDLIPAHIERALFESDPLTYRQRSSYDTDPTNPALAFGPYRIAKVQPGAEIELTRNDTWHGPEPAFERVIVKVFENTAALEANLLSGSIDMIAGELGLSIAQALAFEARHGERFKIIFKPGLIYEHVDLNLDNPILADLRVRKALIHAIDREAISRQLFAGKQPAAHGSVSPLDWVYSDEVPRYDYDPEIAGNLLDEAGWSELKNGVRHKASGESLTLEIRTTAGDRTRELVEQALQAQWREIGIDVRINNEPARVLFGESATKRKFSAMIMYAWLSAPENVPLTTLKSDQVPTPENGWAGQNYTGYANPEMDRLIDAIERELDRTKRKALWQDLQVLYAEDLPVIPLYWRSSAFILPKWLSGLTPTGNQFTTTQHIELWRASE